MIRFSLQAPRRVQHPSSEANPDCLQAAASCLTISPVQEARFTRSNTMNPMFQKICELLTPGRCCSAPPEAPCAASAPAPPSPKRPSQNRPVPGRQTRVSTHGVSTHGVSKNAGPQQRAGQRRSGRTSQKAMSVHAPVPFSRKVTRWGVRQSTIKPPSPRAPLPRSRPAAARQNTAAPPWQ